MPYDPQQFWLLLPETLLAAAGMVLLLVGVSRGTANRVAASLALVALVIVGAALMVVQGPFLGGSKVILAGTFVLDGFSLAFKMITLLATAITVLLSVRFVEEGGYRAGEYYALILLASTGMMLMASGNNLLSIWTALELMALASYILAGYFRLERRSNEAALKYFVLGALSSGILLYGISLLYGAAGSLGLADLARTLPSAMQGGSRMAALGWILLGAGLFFKVAAAPFHVWTPDVYVGAPTPVTAYLASASKAASFAILMRIFMQALPQLRADWQLIVALVATLSMVWGNLAALTQDNVKRMLAYSSIGHAGYILVGLLAANRTGMWAAIFYLLAYSFITLGAFGVVILLERREYAGETCADYAGLAKRAPGLAAMMLVFLIALTGIPPTGGFVGKFYLFAAAIEAGWSWVAVVGVLMSAVSLYYYFRLVVYMYQQDEGAATPLPAAAPAVVVTVGVCAAVTLLMGLWPGPFIHFAKAAALTLP